MLHILFVILKILAIIVASILGLILFLLLIVLFVPIRYRVDLRTKEEITVKARVNWLLRIVFVRAWFLDHKLHLRLRIFGICIFDNLRPRKPKRTEKTKTTKKAKKAKTTMKTIISKKSRISITQNETHNEIQNRTHTVSKKISQNVAQSIKLDAKNNIMQEITHETTQEITQEITHETTQEVKPVETDIHEEETLTDFKRETVDDIKERTKGKHKIKEILKKISSILKKMAHLFGTIKAKINSLREMIKTLWQKKRLIMSFLKDDMNKAGIKVFFHRIWQALGHCAPKKICGYLKYGTGDPCSTGEVFALAAVFYAKYGGSLTIEPDFEAKVLETEVMVKGRIRIFSLLIIGIKLIRDKKFSKLLKNAKQLKEEL